MHLPILVFSLILVTVGAELLVRGAATLALRMGLSALFVGLTIVGFGTSSPELAASLVATLRGSSDVSVGNVVGSNIFNIAVILGLTAVLAPIRVHFAAVKRDLFIAILAAIVPFVALLQGGTVGRVAGVILLGGLAAFLTLAYRSARRVPAIVDAEAHSQVESTFEGPRAAGRWLDSPWVNVGLVVAGLTLLVIGSRFFVESAIALAAAAGIPELIVGLTIVSAGTSLPELVTSLVAARRGNPDIAVGNVIGSNIFNGFGILGLCATVKAQSVSAWVLMVDAPVTLFVTLALLPIVRSGGQISRKEGAGLLAVYVAYIVGMIWRG